MRTMLFDFLLLEFLRLGLCWHYAIALGAVYALGAVVVAVLPEGGDPSSAG